MADDAGFQSATLGEINMMRLDNYKYSEYRKYVKRIYENSFAEEEKIKFSILKQCNREINVHLDCIILNEVPIGMQFIVDIPNDISYLMYLAIDKEYRNQGIGSKVLQNLLIAKNVLLCIERPIDELTKSRKNFYLRNDFYETNVFIEDNGVQYELLSSVKNYKPTVRDLLNRYRFMTSNKFIFNKIKKAFNAEEIKLIK